MKRFVSIPILIFLGFLVPCREIAFAEGGIAWGSTGKPVCTASGDQKNLRMVSDGSGGAIIVWEDYRGGSYSNIYAQRIDKDGNRLWSQDGMAVAVSTPAYAQSNPVIVGDGSGGAIIAWREDYGGGYWKVYAQKLKSDGYPAWAPNGVEVSWTTAMNRGNPDIVTDNYGEPIITWSELDGSNGAVCVKRVSSLDGSPVWNVFASTGINPKENPKIINDGTGYVIITWQDKTNGLDYDICAQRMCINNGTIPWVPNGKPVSVVSGSDQKEPRIVPDGSGGAIIVWTDCRNGNKDIYAQRIDSNGAPVWAPDGIPVCKMDGEQSNPAITNSLLGGTTDGAIIAWDDTRDDPNGDIYAVKVGLDESNSDLTPGAKLIATGPQVQKSPCLVSDNQGGGIGTWIENGLITSEDEIFATKRGQDGGLLWHSYPGVLVCQDSGIMEHQIVRDGSGGIIVAWQANYDIFAQRVVEAPYKYSASISGRVALSDGETGIPGVEVWALQDEKVISSCITDTKGYYGIVSLLPGSVYLVRANWWANEIESSVTKETFAPSYFFNFTLEVNYKLGTIAGNVSGVEREAKRVSAAGFKNSLSPGNSIAFVELEQRGKVIVRVPLEMEGSYSIPNLLPGRFVARAYNGSIYSNSRTVKLKEGESLRVDFAFGTMPEETVYNYPNPAKDSSTTIRYYCGYADPEAEIKIYNISGELVRKVRDGEIDKTRASENIYSFLWDCKNNSGKEIASGIYIYAVEVKEKGGNGSKKVVKRMAVIR